MGQVRSTEMSNGYPIDFYKREPVRSMATPPSIDTLNGQLIRQVMPPADPPSGESMRQLCLQDAIKMAPDGISTPPAEDATSEQQATYEMALSKALAGLYTAPEGSVSSMECQAALKTLPAYSPSTNDYRTDAVDYSGYNAVADPISDPRIFKVGAPAEFRLPPPACRLPPTPSLTKAPRQRGALNPSP